VLSWLFYGGLLLLMAAILTTLLGRLLPAELARRIGFNSEGYTLAVVLAGWIQFVRPKLTRATRWQVTLVAAACLALALALYTSALPSQFKTLNETFFALSLILPYVTLPRPLRRWPPMASAGLLVAVLVGVASSPGAVAGGVARRDGRRADPGAAGLRCRRRGILEPTARTVSGLCYC